MTLRSILFCRFAVVLSALLSLSASAFAKEKVFEEKIDSLFSKRMELPMVSSKLERLNGKFVPVCGNVIDEVDEHTLDLLADDDLFAAESLYNILNERMLLRNKSLLQKASPEIQRKYKSLSSRFNFINLERIRIHVDFYYDREKRNWVRPVSDSVITMTMIVKSGYFLYQDGDSVIDIRRYGYYIPGSNVKRIFFSDGYSEVLWDSPDMVALDSMRVLPYKLVEKISIENGDVHNRQKIKKLLKSGDFAAIPHVLQEMDEYCEVNSCTEAADYKRYLNMLALLYKSGVLRRF
ncbi:P3 domain protein [Fibrobacter succinogenes subsp. succinogenes S85]|uniref:p3 domain protein n=1 Tax=Fibrobacter succinogenes (strain ATCC 19169 / S85) TaxID=59374 RepID=A7UG41_FIBSS|nr:hypothetical protein [Fibrobacter succinogenes]ABU45472.1 P3 domain protein [Fibrobacter succinogenes subsp. succinogenes S85]ACX75131.1 hypothetical protein Fisuc_1534 [Fibrobacter succinogenes subsp. succinogenes S85]ADL26251.1 P3 domain protein [Fibrobacter succinogenes subsp. succinogenes S85]